jgi:hypothetical protein
MGLARRRRIGNKMAFQHVNASTITTPRPLFTMPTGIPRQTPVTIYNGHSAAIFVGDSTIATSGATIGRTLAAANSQTFYVNGGDVIWAVSAANSAAGAIVITYSA